MLLPLASKRGFELERKTLGQLCLSYGVLLYESHQPLSSLRSEAPLPFLLPRSRQTLQRDEKYSSNYPDISQNCN